MWAGHQPGVRQGAVIDADGERAESRNECLLCGRESERLRAYVEIEKFGGRFPRAEIGVRDDGAEERQVRVYAFNSIGGERAFIVG